MPSNKDFQQLPNENTPGVFLSSAIFDRGIVLALLSLVLLSWFINSFLIV